MATDVAIDPATPTTVYAAFWGQGIYKCTNAGAATPTWTKLTSGLPASGFTRILLGISPSSSQTLYALIANGSYLVNGFCRTTNGGTTWTAIPLPGGNIGGQGFYNLNVAVDPTTPDIVFLSGISCWKQISLYDRTHSERRDSLETVLLLLNERSFSNMLSY